MRTLYLCYLGIREPLVQTQVLPYLRQLRSAGVEVSLLTFEPKLHKSWSREQLARERSRLAAEDIRWFSLPYHKRPSLPATLYDVLRGATLAARLVRRQRIDILHGRSHVGAAMGAVAKRLSGGRLIFDIRGFMPEEYVDAGRWPANGRLHQWTKVAERHLMQSSDGFVVLTEQAKAILFPGAAQTDCTGRPIEVIPCCVDLDRFQAAQTVSRDQVRADLNLTGRRVLAYVGALGGWYLTEEMAEFLAVAHQQDPSTFSMILTQSPPGLIEGPLRRYGVAPQDCLIRQVLPAEVPQYLQAADVALSFVKPCYSKRSSSPTKIAEYLASGLPIVCSAGIGDVDTFILDDRVGVLLQQFNRQAYLEALHGVDVLRMDCRSNHRCRASARDRFDLEMVGGARYQRLYRRVMDRQFNGCPAYETKQ